MMIGDLPIMGRGGIQKCSVIIYPSLVKSKSVLGNFNMGIPGHTHFFPLVAKIVTFRVLIWSMFTISGANNVKKKARITFKIVFRSSTHGFHMGIPKI